MGTFSGLTTFALALVACSSSSTTSPTTSSSSGNGSSTSSSSGGTQPDPAAGTALTGKLGELGEVKPTVSSLWIKNSGETLIYLSSATITCALLKDSRWLGSAEKDSQVVEIVLPDTPTVGDLAVPPAEVNYASGGKSSAYEKNADSGKLTFTKVGADVLEGRFSATYTDSQVSGAFHAEFCDGGQGY